MSKTLLLFVVFLGLVPVRLYADASEHDEGGETHTSLRVFIADGKLLPRVRTIVLGGGDEAALFSDAVANLRSEADALLESGPYSVMFKTGMAPSGDKQDYLSVGPYWWPNPDTEDGLPYIRRDGEVNPDYRENVYDATARSEFNRAWRSLALAWYFTGEDAYAAHAVRLLRVWFLDAETRMNPHMRYAQAVPGRNDGRDVGIVEAEAWRYLPDAVGLLATSELWTSEDDKQLRQWCREFLDWMLTSGALKNYLERGGQNNIAIGLDTLIVSLALYTDQPEVAREQINRLVRERIDTQIELDGRMPKELQRTRAFGYTIKALNSFFVAARLAEHLDMDLWNYTTSNQRNLRLALDFLLPYLYAPDTWTYEGGVNIEQTGRTLLPLAIRAWDDDVYREAYQHLGNEVLSHAERLLYPAHLLKKK